MVKTKKKTVRIKYEDRKYFVEFDVFGSFELFGSSHDDNLFLMNNEDKIRKEIRDKYEEK